MARDSARVIDGERLIGRGQEGSKIEQGRLREIKQVKVKCAKVNGMYVPIILLQGLLGKG